MAGDFENDGAGELTRLRERVALLEREIVGARAHPAWESLEASPIPIWTTRADRIAFANEPAARLVGANSPAELLGRSIFDFIAPEYHDLVRFRSREELEFGRETPVVEQEMIRLDGSRIDVQVTTLPFPQDGPSSRHVSIIDITERKNAERHLLEISERFHELADNIREVFCIFDPKALRMLYVSPGYELIWQRSVQSLYDAPLSWMDAIHPDDEERIRTAFQSVDTFKEEYRILRQSGELRWIRARTFPIRGADGELLRVVAFFEDITQWKRLEQQLVQSQKMDAIGRLAGGIAHDFNNLLTVINGYSAMLVDRLDLPAGMLPDLQSICRAGGRAASLTAQLLAFSRMQLLQPKNIDLNETVAGLEPILRRLIREDVDLRTVLVAGHPCVTADPTQIEQVLLNLVINARDAIEGTGLITIETGDVVFDAEAARLHAGCSPGHYALIAVSDTGRGMSAHIQERIFEPFFTTKNTGQGTGLGLATVYGIVKQSGGGIFVYSEEGVGSTFKVFLPLVSDAIHGEQESRQREISGGTATVLIVEDEEQVRRIACAVLRARGYRVFEACNGQEALKPEFLLPINIDLLVTDVIMPKMGGPELAQKLCARNPDMRVLFISGYTDNASIHKGIWEAGMHHLAKPFTPDALARKVSEVLEPRVMNA
jgi:two-component system, cell cycle sensor histidine kinase and response regulator CckA